jgi:hypothetical protein
MSLGIRANPDRIHVWQIQIFSDGGKSRSCGYENKPEDAFRNGHTGARRI